MHAKFKKLVKRIIFTVFLTVFRTSLNYLLYLFHVLKTLVRVSPSRNQLIAVLFFYPAQINPFRVAP